MNSHSSWFEIEIENESTSYHGAKPMASNRNAKRLACKSEIQEYELACRRLRCDSDIRDKINNRLEIAKRFLKAHEFGACQYELRIVRQMIREIEGCD